MSATWLITGAQGLVGRYLAAAALIANPALRIIGIGRSARSNNCFSHSISGPDGFVPAPLPRDICVALSSPQYCYLKADILDGARVSSLLGESRPNVIVHLASGLRGDARQKLFEVNVEGTAQLLEAVGQIPNYTPTVLLGSTGGVYGAVSPHHLPLSESEACNPADEYTISKHSLELLARVLSERKGFRLKVARIFNVIGQGQDERHTAGHIAAELLRVQSGRQPLLRLGSSTPTRDFVDVRDAATALVALTSEDVADGVYNIASGEERSIGQLLAEFRYVSGSSAGVQHEQERTFGVPRHVADVARLSAVGFAPRYSFRDSVESVWHYYRQLWEPDLTEGASTLRAV